MERVEKAHWQRLTVLGCLSFLAERLANEEGSRETLARVRHLLSIADGPELDDETSVTNLRRALDTKDPWNVGVRRETYEESVKEAAPLVAAVDWIVEVLRPRKPPGGSIFGKVIRD